jgi:SAM-dependent methyltransferase
MPVDPPQQHRGSGDAYARYLAAMDASMRQKVALTAAHFICRGRVADMGMGSGAGTHALAALYPGLEVVGVDLDPEMVAIAAARHQLSNLRFVQGDVARPPFDDRSLDGILDSSVLHHVTSFGGYRHENAAEALSAQVRTLRTHGVLVVRDFVAPEDGGAPLLLDLPGEAVDRADDPRTCSSASLLLRFAREFRSLSPAPGFPCEELPPPRAGWRRFRLSHRHAVEFLLRKDYRDDWVQEAKEEYTWSTQRECEALFARLGLRLLASTPIRNPWILRHRWEGQVELRREDGRPLELPPTNYLAAGERVPAGEGVRFRASACAPAPPGGFLALRHLVDRESGQVRDLVRRPNLTVDVLPHFDLGGEAYVLARMSYPRPLLAAGPGVALDGSAACAYATEPLSAIQGDRPLGDTIEELLCRFGLPAERILRVEPAGTYYPSPGGLEEEVRAMRVEVEPTLVEEPVENRTGFSTAGRVRAIEAQQVLRAAQVGGLADARLELNVYQLLLDLGRDPGPWIGSELELAAGGPVAATPLRALRARPPRRRFAPAPEGRRAGFLTVSACELEELDGAGAVVARRTLEAVAPASRSLRTVALALLRRDAQGTAHLGLDDDDLPAAQGFTGQSSLLIAPAWRLPLEVASLAEGRRFAAARLLAEYGAEAGRFFELGGRYHPTPGATAEVVHPWAVEVTSDLAGPRRLCWVPLAELVRERGVLLDGHLRVVALRAAHALGLLRPGLADPR